ncbi:phosphonate metabolism transcriptional regulator PhnF [Rhodovarius crocodyli]|uniref:Phosphonate metabolism transcriptional regulator PhnF n=1 Tax=Rhodovarius crocodyli TaxID=1979269 RepID=A0A437M2T5_9PROT|nr:phosphonate metabolism transcriptional regulator PhnF [Rhodovarius crocodyli]RVT91998.1 phosphonate metabolism transcriptional regulator PhnF [Rhodovarius crocodyli]
MSDTALPIYMQLAHQIGSEIRALYRPGELLPSEGTLTKRFGVNRHTLRRAIAELVQNGLLESRKGVGSYVLDTGIEYPLQPSTRFTSTLMELGHSTDTRVLELAEDRAEGGVARALRLGEGAPVFRLETLRSVDERPFCLITHFMPAACCPYLATEYRGGSLHGWLKEQHGLALRRVSSVISSIMPRGNDARLLGIGSRQPVLRVKSLNVSAADATPVEYALTRFRGDRVQLSVDF